MINLDAYMARLGQPEPTLPAVVAAHAAHIPFENLDPLRGVTPRLDAEGPQPTPHEPFRIVPAGEDRYLEAEVRGAWQRLYRFDLQRQHQVDYEVSNHYLCTHPRSHFRAGVMAARAEPDARYALRNGKLSIHRPTGSEQRDLASVAEIKQVLRELFHVEVPVDEALDAALARGLAQ